MRILFFLESLQSGGKERRSVELIKYLSEQPENYEMELVLSEDNIHYEEIFETGIPITILKRENLKYDPSLFFRFYRLCRRFNPDLVHCFGKMTTFYAIPSKVICNIPLISSLIADSKKSYTRYSPYSLLLKINVFFSDMVLANSIAGLNAYNLHSGKARVIYNGVRLSRFSKEYEIELVRKEFHIVTPYIVVMVAGFSNFKDYDLFLDIARAMASVRKDVTFIAVGDGMELDRIEKRISDESIGNVILTGRQKDVERIIAISDIGLLCTKAEGISNSIIEYMALGKPVIVTDTTGGSSELVKEGETGYCTERRSDVVFRLLNTLLNDQELRFRMGQAGRARIESSFSINRMGEEFKRLYDEALYAGK